MEVGKVIGVTALVAGGGFLVYKLLSKTAEVDTFIKKVQIGSVKASSVKISGGNIVIVLNITIYNPTKLSVSFQKPTVTIKYGNKVLANSKPSYDRCVIEAQGESIIKGFTFEIPILSNANTLKNLFGDLIQNVDWSNLSAIINAITNNLPKVLSKLGVDVLIYIGSTPITYTTQLSQ